MTAVFCAVVLSGLSQTGINTALPVMAVELGIAPADSIWIVSGFQLALVSTLLAFAAAGEKWGFRRLFLGGLVAVGAASAFCAFRPAYEMLLAARLVQGLGASAVMAVCPALIRHSVPRASLGMAIGLNAMVVAVIAALGPSIAALILTFASWPWIFALNLPFVVLAIAMGCWALPRDTHSGARHFDLAGAVLNLLAFGLGFAGVQVMGASVAGGSVLIVVSLLFAVLLVRQQRHRQAPLLPLDLLRIYAVRSSALASIFMFSAQLAALVSMPFLLHDVLGKDMLATGLILMAWPVAVGLMAVAAAHLERRMSPEMLCAFGGGVLGLGLLLQALIALSSGGAGDAMVVLTMLICGVGFGCFQTPNARVMIGATPHSRSGSAGGLQATVRLVGQAMGTTMAGVMFHVMVADTKSAVAATLAFALLCAITGAAISLRRHCALHRRAS